MSAPGSASLLVLFALGLLGGGCEPAPRGGDPTSGVPSKPQGAIQMAVDEGCPHQDGTECTSPHEAPPSDKKKAYGAPLGTSPRVALTDVLAQPEKYHEKTVIVSGYVRRACTKKGCWMEVAADEAPASPSCRVTFKDYGFLVPTDSATSRALLEAKVQMTEVKAEAVQHYEAEGAQFPGKKADGTAVEVRLVATGVELERT